MIDVIEATEELLTKEQEKQLRDAHGEFTAVSTKMGAAAFRVPTRAEYAQYNRYLFDEKTRANATGYLVSACVVLPDRKTFETWLDKYPGIVLTCADAVNKLAGVDTEAQTKKYTPA